MVSSFIITSPGVLALLVVMAPIHRRCHLSHRHFYVRHTCSHRRSEMRATAAAKRRPRIFGIPFETRAPWRPLHHLCFPVLNRVLAASTAHVKLFPPSSSPRIMTGMHLDYPEFLSRLRSRRNNNRWLCFILYVMGTYMLPLHRIIA